MQGFPAINCTANRPPALSSKIIDYVRASLSDNSCRAYSSDLRHFVNWGGSIPANPEMVAGYLAAYAASHSVATLSRRLVSIGKAHSSLGLESPTKSDLVKATLRGVRHVHGSAQRRVAAAIKEDVLSMVTGLDGVQGARDAALLLLGFAGAFRRSELVALDIADLQKVQQGLLVNLRFSKTDQGGVGRTVAIPFARGVVCPVLALRRWIEIAGISEGPVFRAINRHGQISDARLSSQSVAIIVKRRAKDVGLDPSNYAGHSLRSGLVTSAAMMGVSSWKIRQQTGHKSDAMLARYIRDANVFVDNAAGAIL